MTTKQTLSRQGFVTLLAKVEADKDRFESGKWKKTELAIEFGKMMGTGPYAYSLVTDVIECLKGKVNFSLGASQPPVSDAISEDIHCLQTCVGGILDIITMMNEPEYNREEAMSEVTYYLRKLIGSE